MITFQQLLRKTRVQKPNKLRCSRFFGNPFGGYNTIGPNTVNVRNCIRRLFNKFVLL